MIRFTRLNKSHLEKILTWRTQPDVTRYMFTDIEYNLENQHKWFERVKESETDKYWVISYGDVDFGVVSLNGIDHLNKKTSAGFYIGDHDYRKYGFFVLLYLYNYVFHELKLNKIYAEVMGGNESVIKFHTMYGFREVGIYRQHIYKYGSYHDVFLFELLKEKWLQIGNKYEKYTAKFE
ncbi:UDP-4-amino-4,6-dideoxy-N-acetyl-beta-L-altrosamine N-acetyltransferase [Paenibacillus sp. GXUN7292]|uniref:UDP-4-amino-4, 6-dideoxy-N-acetyl-beta-L-altrosamine N-acetyltransferase n=1 Tax=Paenibacillus sp. GXUN7292 TaxID=3422499 RepID=UPI003D7CE2FD